MNHDLRPRRSLHRSLRRLLRAEDGAALVEFAIALPMMLLVFAVIVEGSRLMMSFQSAISGVRDATRYMSRVVASDICATGGSVAGYATQLQTIVSESVSGQSVFPNLVAVDLVTPSYSCIEGAYRVSPAPVVEVSAQITVIYPFAGIFTMIGGSLPSVTTTITDRSRIFGS